MAINFTRLFTTLGKLVGGLNEANSYRGTTFQTRITTVDTRFTTVFPWLASGLYDSGNQATSSFSSWLTYLQSLARSTLIEEVCADRPVDRSLSVAWTELIRQMVIGNETLKSLPTTTSVSAAAPNIGDANIVITTKDGTGQAQDLILPDSYLLQITGDQNRGGVKYSETFTIKGKTADSSILNYDYSVGTGVNLTSNLYNPATSLNGMTVDPGFDNWSANTPSNWTISAGANSTNVFQIADDPRDGALGNCAGLKSTGSLVKLKQQLTVTPNTVYGATAKFQVANSTGTFFQVSLSLTNSTGTVLTDDQGSNQTITSTASNATSGGWHSIGGFFITPKVSADETWLEVRLHKSTLFATAADANNFADVDHVQLAPARQMYLGGPFYSAYSGNLAAVTGDLYTLAITSPSSGNLPDYLVIGLERLLNIRSLNPRIPTTSSGNGTQPNSLIS